MGYKKFEELFAGVKHIISKLFLLLLGMALLMSQMWPYILLGFLKTERAIRDFGSTSDWSLIFLGISFVVGGVWLNTLLGFFKTAFDVIMKKITK